LREADVVAEFLGVIEQTVQIKIRGFRALLSRNRVHAPQRTAAGRRGSNRHASWPLSLISLAFKSDPDVISKEIHAKDRCRWHPVFMAPESE